jgi:hypothetical protein
MEFISVKHNPIDWKQSTIPSDLVRENIRQITYFHLQYCDSTASGRKHGVHVESRRICFENDEPRAAKGGTQPFGTEHKESLYIGVLSPILVKF